MKKILLPVLFLTLFSCGKTEIKEIEKIVEVEKEVSIPNNENVINEAVILLNGSLAKEKRDFFVSKMKEFVNGEGSICTGHYLYYGRYSFDTNGTYTSNYIIVVSNKDFIPVEVNRYTDGQYKLNYEPVKAQTGQYLKPVASFDQNKYIGYLSKAEILSLK